MPDFTNVRDLVNYIQKKAVESVQKTDSATQRTMIEKGKEHVQSDVYDKYIPSTYERSGKLKENWEIENTENGISMTNTRTSETTGKNIAYTVEHAIGYDYHFPYEDIPRPFIKNTFIDLQSGNELKNAVKKDLKQNGLNTE